MGPKLRLPAAMEINMAGMPPLSQSFQLPDERLPVVPMFPYEKQMIPPALGWASVRRARGGGLAADVAWNKEAAQMVLGEQAGGASGWEVALMAIVVGTEPPHGTGEISGLKVLVAYLRRSR